MFSLGAMTIKVGRLQMDSRFRGNAQWRPAKIEAGPLKEVADWVEQYRRFWDTRLDALDNYLKTIQTRGKAHVRKRK